MALHKLPKNYHPDFKVLNKKPVYDAAVDYSEFRLESYLQINPNLTDLVREKPLPLNLYSNAVVDNSGINAISGSAQFPFVISQSVEKTVVVVGKAFSGTDATIGADGEATSVNIATTSINVKLDGFGSSFTPLVALAELDDACVVVRAFADNSWVAYGFKLKTGEYLGTCNRTAGGATSFINSTGAYVGFEITGFGRQGYLSACYSMPYDVGIEASFRLGREPYQVLRPKQQPVYFTADGGGGSESIVIDSGAYSLSGTDISLKASHKTQVDSGSYTLTGTATGLIAGYKAITESGTYTLTGSELQVRAAYNEIAQSGSYDLTGTDVTLVYTPSTPGQTLVIDSGSFALTGTSTPLKAEFNTIADTGSYALTGSDIQVRFGSNMVIDPGAYSLTGQNVGLTADYGIIAGNGAYSLTGTIVNLKWSGDVTQTIGQVTAGFADSGITAEYKQTQITVNFKGL